MKKTDKIFTAFVILALALQVGVVICLFSLARAIRNNTRAVAGQADHPIRIEIKEIK